MRLMKLLSIALLGVAALLGGFLVAAVIAGATVVAWVVRRFIFKIEAIEPGEELRPVRSPSSGQADDDVIDIAATEIPK